MARLHDAQCALLWETRYRARLARVAELDSADPGARSGARLSVYNLFQCEAHVEHLARALELLAAGRLASDRAAREQIEALLGRLKAFGRTGSSPQ